MAESCHYSSNRKRVDANHERMIPANIHVNFAAVSHFVKRVKFRYRVVRWFGQITTGVRHERWSERSDVVRRTHTSCAFHSAKFGKYTYMKFVFLSLFLKF